VPRILARTASLLVTASLILPGQVCAGFGHRNERIGSGGG
jgi:hypothetical protein